MKETYSLNLLFSFNLFYWFSLKSKSESIMISTVYAPSDVWIDNQSTGICEDRWDDDVNGNGNEFLEQREIVAFVYNVCTLSVRYTCRF